MKKPISFATATIVNFIVVIFNWNFCPCSSLAGECNCSIALYLAGVCLHSTPMRSIDDAILNMNIVVWAPHCKQRPFCKIKTHCQVQSNRMLRFRNTYHLGVFLIVFYVTNTQLSRKVVEDTTSTIRITVDT